MSNLKKSRKKGKSSSAPVRSAQTRVSRSKKGIIILGMHRSGTSAFTRVFNLLGADLPNNIIKPADCNQSGFWESRDLVTLHDELLASAGSSWDDISPFPSSWYSSEFASVFKDRMHNILENEFIRAKLFVIKDSRICRFVPFWLRVLDDYNTKPVFILSFRNPLEVAASLKKRDNFNSSKSLLLWLRHVLDAERCTRGYPRSFVSYDSLLRDWRKVISKISHECRISWPRTTHTTAVEIEQFLSDKERHHNFLTSDIEVRTDIVDWITEIYSVLLKADKCKEHVISKAYDKVYKELELADKAFGPIIADNKIHIVELHDLNANRDAEIARLTDELSSTQLTLAERDKESGLLRDEMAQRQSQLRDRDVLMNRLREELEELHHSTFWRVTSPLRRLATWLRVSRSNRQYIATLLAKWWNTVRLLFKKPVFTARLVAIRLLPNDLKPLVVPFYRKFLRKRYLKELEDAFARPDICESRVDAVSNPFSLPPSSLCADDIDIGTYKRLVSPRHFRVLYVSGDPSSPSHRFRIENHIEYLTAIGIQAAWIPVYDVKGRLSEALLYDLIVFWRVAWTEEVQTLLDNCREAGIPTIFDVDDYVFEPDIVQVEKIDGIRFLSKEKLAQYWWGVERYRKCLEEVDYCTMTTKFLADRANELGKQTWVLQNGLSDSFVRISEEACSARQEGVSTATIGFASGSKTHQKDFGVIAKTLTRILSRYDNVRLEIVGDLELAEFPDLLEFSERIEHRPKVPWDQLPYELARFDINLAPLEIGNPFCEAKSELKYFDAALVGVPTVASATSTFVSAIQDGETGYLAVGETDWYQAVTRLIEDPSHRRRMASRAREDVITRYGPETMGTKIRDIYSDIIKTFRRSRGVDDEAFSIRIFLPPIAKGSGGHHKVISVAKALAGRGMDIRLHFTDRTDDYTTKAAVDKEFRLSDAGVRVSMAGEPMYAGDALIATFWKTAYLAREHSELVKRIFYFLQDFEPYFYPMGDDYILAELSYNLGLRHISYGPWVKHMVESRLGVTAEHIPFYIDLERYREKTDMSRRNDLVVWFARPDMPRRCFFLVVQALQSFWKHRKRDVEIAVFGSSEISRAYIPFPHRNLGVLSPEELVDLYNRGTIGVAFSPTNPSMIPFEMMACGLPVIDVDYDNEATYGGRDVAMLCAPDPHEIGEAINLLMENEALRRQHVQKGLEFISSFPTETEALLLLYNILRADILEESKATQQRHVV